MSGSIRNLKGSNFKFTCISTSTAAFAFVLPIQIIHNAVDLIATKMLLQHKQLLFCPELGNLSIFLTGDSKVMVSAA